MNQKPRPAPDTITGHWGIFGGMFDPVHLGHVTLVEDLSAAENLDGLLLVPGLQPPHRSDTPLASFGQRCLMLRLAFADWKDVIITDIERRMTPPAYTLDVVRLLKREYPDARFSFLIGADQLEKFATWYEPAAVLKEVQIIAGARPGYAPPTSDPLTRQIKFVATRPVDVSSTRIREAVKTGCTVEQLATFVPATVAQFIVENRLYQ